MFLPEPSAIERAHLDEAIAALPNSDAVFLVWAGERSAYLAKTSMLRRRLLRVLPADASGRKSLNLRGVVSRVDYWLTASRFESSLIHYTLAKAHFPGEYLKLVKLRMPAYVKLEAGLSTSGFHWLGSKEISFALTGKNLLDKTGPVAGFSGVDYPLSPRTFFLQTNLSY